MLALQINLFNGIQIQMNGQFVALAYDKVRALLAYLLIEADQPQRREKLAGLLWPEQPEKEARHSLSQALLKLRQAIDPNKELIISDRYTVGWKVGIEFELDTAVFTTNLHQCQTHQHAQPDLCESCMARRETAISLYNGPFLAGLSLLDAAPAFEQWQTQQREQFHRQVMEALDTLTTYFAQRGELPKAIQYAQRQLTLEPWREETHYQLMRLFLYNGQRSSAIAQYLTCVQTLADDLGIEPSPKTNVLYKLIQTAQATPPHILPLETTPFVGRHAEIAQITSLLAAKNGRLITVLGPGGMGKSRLAQAVAQRQLGRPIEDQVADKSTYAFFTHGVYWVSLVGVETAVSLVPTIADALGFQFEHATADSSHRSVQEQLIDYLRQKRILLILDNFEQLLTESEAREATAVINAILHNAPKVQLIVTSRERLQLTQEQLYPLQGLAYPETQANTHSEYTALTLFKQTAQRIQPNFEVDEAEQTAVAHICRLLDGMPLAVELAASSINILSPREIVTELQHSLDLLATSNRHTPMRHQSMHAAFETSWQRLTQQEQRLLAKLSVFRDGFTRRAAVVVADAQMPRLAALVNKTLLHFDPATKRYGIHELLRQFAAEKLGEDGQMETAVCRQHAHFFTHFLREEEPRLKSVHQPEALTAIEADLENIRTAWQWAGRNMLLDWLQNGIYSLGLFFATQNRQIEGRQLFQRSINLLKRADASFFQPNIWAWKGLFDQLNGDFDAAQQSIQASLDTFEHLKPISAKYKTTKAFILLQHGNLLLNSIPEEAIICFENSLALLDCDADPWHYAEGLFGLGMAHYNMGNYVQSKTFLEQSLGLREKMGERRKIAETFAALSVNANWQGEYDLAVQLAHKANHLYQELGDKFNRARGLGDLGTSYTWADEPARGLPLLEESLSIFEDLGDQVMIARAHYRLTGCYGKTGDLENGRASAQRCVELSQSINNYALLSQGYLMLGMVSICEESFDEAETFLSRAHKIAKESKQLGIEGLIASTSALVEASRGHLAKAQNRLNQALRIALEYRDFATITFNFVGQARFWLALAAQYPDQQTYQKQAIVLTTQSYAFPLYSPVHLDILIGRQYQALISELPPEFVTAVQEESREKSVWQVAEDLLQAMSEIKHLDG
jgi:DNA-binding SARP family transcriptional activator/predicted ATPase